MFSWYETASVPRIFKIVLLACLAAVAAWMLLLRIQFELAGAFHGDTSIYLTVARGMLKGLTPYADLYENKTPGIFILAAASLWLFDNVTLLTWLQAAVLLFLPFTLVLPVSYGEGFIRTPGKILFAWILGCALALYTATMAGTLLPESFGAFFGAAFVALLASRSKITWPLMGALSFLLLLASGMKEPFLISSMAGALIVLPNFKSAKKLLPIGLIAILAGAQILLLLGYFWPYVSINLYHIFSFHVFNPWGSVNTPLWMRTFDILRVAENMRSFSLPFLFIMGIVCLGALFLVLRTSASKERLQIGLRWILALWLMMLSLSVTGDFYGHHFICAVPVYVACILVALREWKGDIPLAVRSIVPAILCVLLAALFYSSERDYSGLIRSWKAWAAPRIEAANALDTVMDRCSIERYFDDIDRPEGVYGFTRHSPYGPIFTQYGRFVGVMNIYLQGLGRALAEAPILIMRTPEEAVDLDEETRADMRKVFTENPWPCAGQDFRQPSEYRILFREGAR